MKPGRRDITIYRGIDWEEVYQWRRDDVVQPLDGFTSASLTFRPHGLATIEIAASIDVGTDKITASVPGPDTLTSDWGWDEGTWSLDLIDNDGPDVRLVQGAVNVRD